jgi:hypothetical protein
MDVNGRGQMSKGVSGKDNATKEKTEEGTECVIRTG